MERAAIVLVVDACVSAVIRLARPSRATHEDEVVGILTDNRNHLIGMLLHGIHATGRFVPNFENHVVVLAVFLGCIFEELDSSVSKAIGAFDVPVDNHVNVFVNGCIHHRLEQSLLEAFATRRVRTARAVELFVSGTESKTHNFDTHVVNQAVDTFFGVEVGRIGVARAPEEAHTLDLNSLLRVFRARTRKLATICDEFTVCAHRANTACSHCHCRSHGSARQ